jgi:2-polyprenyl-3-methyl-5-hydroxy-6-metoxy-1,4-benzoquinol methylase
VPSEVVNVLADWGDGAPGPMNGESGRGLSDLLVETIGGMADARRVCDLGCGNGFLAARLGGLGREVVGVDASQRLLRVAETNYASPSVRFKYGVFGPELSGELLAEGPFDLVVSVDVIEHLFRPISLLETAAAILKPGGIMIVCTPYHGYLKNLAISVYGGWDSHFGVHWDGGHVKFFSVRTLSAMVGRAFEVERFAYFGRVPGLWKNMICIARKRPA